MVPVVAIVGRPNVGKSTLANRIARVRKFLVRGEVGVTRDRNYVLVTRYGKPFSLVDTGGIVPGEGLLAKVRHQAEFAISEADLVIFVVDGKEGLHPYDFEIASILRRSSKPVLLAVNKIDSPKDEPSVGEFFELGFKEVYGLSAEQRSGVGELIDKILELIPEESIVPGGEQIKVAVIGRPNVGKSSLINRILGYERIIVTESPGTTRDPVDTPFQYGGKSYLLVDTAGIRRRARVKAELERDTVRWSLSSIRRCYVALVILDATEGVTDQDLRLARFAIDEGRGTAIVVNKWDLARVKEDFPVREFLNYVERQFAPLGHPPVISVSALTGLRVMNILKVVDQVFAEYSKRVPPDRLSSLFKEWAASYHPPLYQGHTVRINCITQVGVKPPTFLISTNLPQGIDTGYERYLVNHLRGAFGFKGTPIRLIFKKG